MPSKKKSLGGIDYLKKKKNDSSLLLILSSHIYKPDVFKTKIIYLYTLTIEDENKHQYKSNIIILHCLNILYPVDFTYLLLKNSISKIQVYLL